MPVEDTALPAVFRQISKSILDKLEKGKRLPTEDIPLLYTDTTYMEPREIRGELRETNKIIDETNKRIVNTSQEMSEKVENIHRELVEKIEETNRRIDKLYEPQAAREKKPLSGSSA